MALLIVLKKSVPTCEDAVNAPLLESGLFQRRYWKAPYDTRTAAVAIGTGVRLGWELEVRLHLLAVTKFSMQAMVSDTLIGSILVPVFEQ